MPTEVQLNEDRLDRLNVFAMAGTLDKYQVSDTANGAKLVHGVEVFKAGTFKDSLGEQRTWTIEQLAQMVNNFGLLRDNAIFPNVPLRVDHSWDMDSVIGYIAALGVSGDRLVADLEITEPDHYEKFDRGTYRSRSLEVGMYEDNNGTIYFPVVLGLAFVDIPAVEGLHRGAHRVGCFRLSTSTNQTGEEKLTVPEKTPEAPAPFTFRINGAEETDYAKVQTYLAQVEGENVAFKARVESLEIFQREQVTKSRHDYVSGLATLKKIAATQIDSLKSLVDLMSDEQFKAFTDSYDTAPSLSVLGNHSGGVTNPSGDLSAVDDERHVIEETVAMHRRAGMSDEDVAKTASYKRLVALNGAGKGA